MELNKCAHCGEETSNKRFCSIRCTCAFNNAQKQIHFKYEKQCKQCHNTYIAYSANKNTKFCSNDCFNKWKTIAYKGRKLTNEWLQNQNHSKRRENIVKFGVFICENCGKEFETNLSLRGHRSYCNHVEKDEKFECDSCGKTYKRMRWLMTHKKTHDSEWKAKHSLCVKIAIQDRQPPKRNSAAELRFLQVLQLLYPDVQHRFRINDVNHEYDFYVPSKNLIIEYDGDYWHGNKEKFTLTQTMKKQYVLDKQWTQLAKNMDMKFIEFGLHKQVCIHYN